MCARYYIADVDTEPDLQQFIDAVRRKSNCAELKVSGEVYPGNTAPVIANNRKMLRDAFAMKWGFHSPSGNLIINARSETSAYKPMFRDSMLQRRCIIPASWYFEWEHKGADKIRYAIRSCTANIMYLAGLYRFEYVFPVFTVLTRSPADNIKFIHDRMPVILPKDMINDWLNPKYKADDLMKYADLSVSYINSPETV